MACNPKFLGRRRRIELPSLDNHFIDMVRTLRQPSPPNDCDVTHAKQVIDGDIAKCDIKESHPYDSRIIIAYRSNVQDRVTGPLIALYYRGRIQSTIWDVFTLLHRRRYLALDCLRMPTTLRRCSAGVRSVAWRLETFEGPLKEFSPELISDPPGDQWEERSMTEAICWLATMIVRGCNHNDIERVFETIEASEFLGGRNEEAHTIYMEQCYDKKFVRNLDERAASEIPSNNFGFWLPHGLGCGSEEDLENGIRECVGRFNAAERAFKHYFRIGDNVVSSVSEN